MSTGGLRHRLRAILAADAVGYSRLMAADDRATVASLDKARRVFKAVVALHEGRIIDTAGDSAQCATGQPLRCVIGSGAGRAVP